MARFRPARYSFASLVLFFVLITALGPYIPVGTGRRAVSAILCTGVLIITSYVLSNKKKWLFSMLGLAIPAIVGNWLLVATQINGWLLNTTVAFQLAFFSSVVAIIFRYVFSAPKVNMDILYGAFSCYLMIGILWAFMYVLVDSIQPGSFTGPLMAEPEIYPENFDQFLYFSFVTLSTLGFGDLTPVSHEARNLVILEVLTGQFYIAVLVSRLIGLHIHHRINSSS